VEDWAEIRRLRRSEGMAIQAIARRLRVSRNTVKKALASDSPPRYSRRRWTGGSREPPVGFLGIFSLSALLGWAGVRVK
jgi:transcriptional regulator with XRE-family HTH domain